MRSKTATGNITLQVPQGFDALTVAKKYRRQMRDQQLLADRLNWFMSLLVVLPYRQDIRKELETRGYISLQHEKFVDLYRSDRATGEIITILVKKEKVVDRDTSYSTGNYSKGYRLNGALLTGRTKLVPVLTKEMREYLQAYWRKVQEQQKKLVRSVKFLTDFIEDPELTADLEGAHHFVEHWVHQLEKKILSHADENGADLTAELINRAYTKVFYAKELLRRINNPNTVNNRYWKRDPKGLRLHSSFTGLKSPLRHFLRYKDKQLVSIDIMSSQPYLFTRLLDRDFWEKKSQRPNLRAIHPQLYQKLSDVDALSSIIMSTSNLITGSDSGICGCAYKEIPWEKDYYRLLMEQIQSDFQDEKEVYNCYSERGRTKYHNMLLFFEPRVRHFAYTKPFAEYFPGVYSLMNRIRRTPGLFYSSDPKEKSDGRPKNNNLPIILQRLEAEVVLERVCNEIHSQNPDVFLLTIHDSIITTVEHGETVKSYMRRIFTEVIGAAPGLKEELLDKDFVMDGFDEFVDEEWTEMMDAVKKRRRRGRKLTTEYVQQLLANFKTMATEPLVSNVFPQLKDGRKILASKYLSGSYEDLQPDEK